MALVSSPVKGIGGVIRHSRPVPSSTPDTVRPQRGPRSPPRRPGPAGHWHTWPGRRPTAGRRQRRPAGGGSPPRAAAAPRPAHSRGVGGWRCRPAASGRRAEESPVSAGSGWAARPSPTSSAYPVWARSSAGRNGRTVSTWRVARARKASTTQPARAGAPAVPRGGAHAGATPGLVAPPVRGMPRRRPATRTGPGSVRGRVGPAPQRSTSQRSRRLRSTTARAAMRRRRTSMTGRRRR